MIPFELEFLTFFVRSVLFMAPTLLVMTAIITGLGLWVGRREGWAWPDALYYAFITATTVGYGDLHPTTGGSKLIAIGIALTGLLLTGVLVSLAVTSASVAFELTHDVEALREAYRVER
jgi:voltage-gated potassium channel